MGKEVGRLVLSVDVLTGFIVGFHVVGIDVGFDVVGVIVGFDVVGLDVGFFVGTGTCTQLTPSSESAKDSLYPDLWR